MAQAYELFAPEVLGLEKGLSTVSKLAEWARHDDAPWWESNELIVTRERGGRSFLVESDRLVVSAVTLDRGAFCVALEAFQLYLRLLRARRRGRRSEIGDFGADPALAPEVELLLAHPPAAMVDRGAT